MTSCNYCGRFAKTRRIKTPDDFEGIRKKDYVLICGNCENKLGLQDVPTFIVDELEDFVENMQGRSIVPTMIYTDSENKKYIQFHDGNLYFLNRDELKFIADEIYKTLELGEGLDDFIKEENARNSLLTRYFESEYDSNKFEIPFDRISISRRKFDTSKRKWSFHCGNCGEKKTSIDGGNYISIMPDEFEFKTDVAGWERACNAMCARVIVREYIQNWINDNPSAKKYFYLDNLESQITSFIAKKAL